MSSRRLHQYLRFLAVAYVICSASGRVLWAQGPTTDALPDAPSAMPSLAVLAASPVVLPAPPQPPAPVASEHRFWDKPNIALCTASAALSAADFAVTRANLQRGGRELNPVVRLFGRSTAGLATNFIGETAGGFGLSYFFHKTGHHKLERIVPLVNIGTSAGAVSCGLAHRYGKVPDRVARCIFPFVPPLKLKTAPFGAVFDLIRAPSRRAPFRLMFRSGPAHPVRCCAARPRHCIREYQN